MVIHFIPQISVKLKASNFSDLSKATDLSRSGLYRLENLTGDIIDCQTNLKLMKYWQCQFEDLWEIRDEEEKNKLGQITLINWSKNPSYQFYSALKSHLSGSVESEANKIGVNPNTIYRLLSPRPLKRIHTPTWGKFMEFYNCNFGDLIELREKKEED